MESKVLELDLSIYEEKLKNEYPFLEDTQIKEFISYWSDFLIEYYFAIID